jgi:energy-coupling factor transporter transmembrane protein EcfT
VSGLAVAPQTVLLCGGALLVPALLRPLPLGRLAVLGLPLVLGLYAARVPWRVLAVRLAWLIPIVVTLSLRRTNRGPDLAVDALRVLLMMMVCTLCVEGLGVGGLLAGLQRLGCPTPPLLLCCLTLRFLEELKERVMAVHQAIWLRGGPSSPRHAARLMAGASTVLLLRTHQRAESLASALELRGYDGRLPRLLAPPLGPRDLWLLAGTVAYLAAVVLR